MKLRHGLLGLSSVALAAAAAGAPVTKPCGVADCCNRATRFPRFTVSPKGAQPGTFKPAQQVVRLPMCDDCIALAARGGDQVLTPDTRRDLEHALRKLGQRRADWSTLAIDGIAFAELELALLPTLGRA